MKERLPRPLTPSLRVVVSGRARRGYGGRSRSLAGGVLCLPGLRQMDDRRSLVLHSDSLGSCRLHLYSPPIDFLLPRGLPSYPAAGRSSGELRSPGGEVDAHWFLRIRILGCHVNDAEAQEAFVESVRSRGCPCVSVWLETHV